jgi:hypothetical protein
LGFRNVASESLTAAQQDGHARYGDASALDCVMEQAVWQWPAIMDSRRVGHAASS